MVKVISYQESWTEAPGELGELLYTLTGWVKGLAVGPNWRVGADTLNIILYQRQVNKKTGKEYWRVHSYYANVANALVELVNQGVRDTLLVDLKAVCDKIDQLRSDILKVCGSNGE